MKRRFRQVKLLDMIFLHFKAEFLYPSPSFPFVYMKVNVVPVKVLKWVKHWKWWLLYVLHLWLIKNSEISKCVQRYTNIDFFFQGSTYPKAGQTVVVHYTGIFFIYMHSKAYMSFSDHLLSSIGLNFSHFLLFLQINISIP